MTKKIEAIIREEKIDAVKHALFDLGIMGFNISSVRGRGRELQVRMNRHNGGSVHVDLTPRAQVNILLSDENVPATVEAILNAAYTGADGDGLIYVYPVDEVIRINTRERGHAAIMYEGDIDARHGVTA